MKVFVKRSELMKSQGPVEVLASYDNSVDIDAKAHGDDAVMLSLPAAALASQAVQTGPTLPIPPSEVFERERQQREGRSAGPTGRAAGSVTEERSPVINATTILVDDWRAKYKQSIVNVEASNRIDDVFPEYSQRNSTAEMNSYITQYGVDSSKWPTAAKNRKAEIDRCWNYVNAVRSKTATMMSSALPMDPTLDNNWPNRIGPYKPV